MATGEAKRMVFCGRDDLGSMDILCVWGGRGVRSPRLEPTQAQPTRSAALVRGKGVGK